MRTMTQRTTFPFLIAESGAASLTLAVTTSPRPARRPRSPPRGKIQDSLRAPELSATSRIVRIPIIKAPPLGAGGRGPETRPPLPLRGSKLRLYIQIRRLRSHLGRLTDHFRQAPPLQLAQRPALHNPHHVAQSCRALLVVGVEFLAFADDAL